ncbi:MAG TPA: UDP-N-acetylenolpyruvoylglucosamine reductase [Clostridiales bacterium]|nr:UDP-N-acetylenolpyruvoylglucosamine reductase [Clostridiales bacterium]
MCSDSGEDLSERLIRIVGAESVRMNEPMSGHTSFRIGGPADLLVQPGSTDQLRAVLAVCRESGTDPFIMGNGSNLLVSDKGIRGVVIKLCENLGRMGMEGDLLVAEAGIRLSRVAKFAMDQGLTGLEFAAGIPGSLGGAVWMNAGAYGGEMKDTVVRTASLDRESGEMKVLEGTAAHAFNYRESIFMHTRDVLVRAWLRLKQGDPAVIRAEMERLLARRRESQPLDHPSAGSVFKRPAGHYTGRLVEECGLKGYAVGDAQVSGKHCGFIVNRGHATALEVKQLIRHVQQEVFRRFGVQLETEIRFAGEE